MHNVKAGHWHLSLSKETAATLVVIVSIAMNLFSRS